MDKMIKNNQSTIAGKVVSTFTFSHEVFGEGFYMVHLEVERLSGNVDTIPVMISERLIDVNEDYIGEFLAVSGQFRSYNRHDGEKNRLILYVFAREASFIEGEIDDGKTNSILLDGYICKPPVYRETPFGREITDILIAVNRPYGKSDYIPCILWGRTARFAAFLGIGTHIEIEGRIQSRVYMKRISSEELEERTAYEVSVSRLEELS